MLSSCANEIIETPGKKGYDALNQLIQRTKLTEVRDAALYWADYYLPDGKVIKTIDIDFDLIPSGGTEITYNYLAFIYYANCECISITE